MAVLVSVITITRNLISASRETAFRQCVESVHAQTYPNIEHIIIDGASSDGTLTLINEYAGRGWLRCRSEEDSGIYDAMNKGVLEAKGEYVVFLNSDDFWHDAHGVEASVAALTAADADFSYAPHTCISEDGTPWAVSAPVLGSFMVRMPFSHQTMFTRREMWQKVGMFDPSFKSAGDYEFILRLILSGAAGVEVPLNFTSFRSGGWSDGNCKLIAEECARALYKNYQPLYEKNEDFFRRMFRRLRVPKALLAKVRPALSATVRTALDAVLTDYSDCSRSAYIIDKFPVSDYINGRQDNSDVYLCHILPLMKIHHRPRYDTYYLWGFLPLWSVKKQRHKRKAYLFGFFPLWEIKEHWRL